MKIGAVAQLGERSVRNAEVEGSIPFGSTFKDLREIASLFHFTSYIRLAVSLLPIPCDSV